MGDTRWVIDTDLLSASGEFLAGLGTIILAIVAVFAVNSWRNELVGKDEYEIGKKLLVLYYRAFFVIDTFRRRQVDATEGVKLLREFNGIADGLGVRRSRRNGIMEDPHCWICRKKMKMRSNI